MTISITDNILKVLRKHAADYERKTYLDTYGNEFTLLDTPGLWNSGPVAPQPSAASAALLQNIGGLIGRSNHFVDITTLWQTRWSDSKDRFPDGAFKKQIALGLNALFQRRSNTTVRILVGVPFPAAPGEYPTSWLRSLLAEADIPQKLPFPIFVATNRTNKALSWNHAKMIARDGEEAIVGGHNLWAEAYLGPAPVHDVSGLFKGPAAGAGRLLSDILWSKGLISLVSLIDGKFSETRPNLPAFSPQSGSGGTRILSLARLGEGLAHKLTMGSNAALAARLMALCSASSSIKISQQSLSGVGFPFAAQVPYPYAFDIPTCLCLVQALCANVRTEIVVSNNGGDYSGRPESVYLFLWAVYLLYRDGKIAGIPQRNDLDAWAKECTNERMESMITESLLREVKGIPRGKREEWTRDLERLLTVAPIYYARDLNYWDVGGGKTLPAYNHSKIYIIDGSAFFVGSDNMYRSGTIEGLQELGYLVSGQQEVSAFVSGYWDKLWANSGCHPVRPDANRIVDEGPYAPDFPSYPELELTSPPGMPPL